MSAGSASNAARVPLPPSDPDPDREPRRIVALMILTVALFFGVAAAWSALAQLDVAVNARGSVIPPSRLQEVQALESGIVEEMRVVPGQRVKRGEVLLRLDTAQFEAEVGESRQYRLAALAGRARTEALIEGRAPRFDDPELRAAPPELLAKELQLWQDAQREHEAARAAARQAVAQRAGEIAEAQSRRVSLDAQVRTADEAFRIEERLLKEGAGARADFLAVQQRLQQLTAEREALVQALPRLQAALAQAQAAERELESRARTQWGAQRTEFATRAAALASTLEGKTDRAARREITSPVDGIVNRVLVPTRGGVAMAGRPIVEIVPEEADLTIAVRVRPSDIGFIHAGQEATVRVLAYDAATHGAMKGTVSRVGADAVVDDKGEAYFEVQISAAPGQIRLHGQPLPVTPGMPVDAGILTGERSVLQYLLKPVLRGLQESLRER